MKRYEFINVEKEPGAKPGRDISRP